MLGEKMLINGSPLIHMLNQFRVIWFQGSYGGGKTLLAYELAYELYQTGRYRYILGNSNSVWTDSPPDVELRDGSFVDAIVILDEGGLFMKVSSDADAFMLGLRKLNITLLVPSVTPPSTRIKFLRIQRIINGMSFGLPFWLYQYQLSLGFEKERAYVGIWKPQEIYGIYDTIDYPMDDCYMSDWLFYWMQTARESRPEWCTWGEPPEFKGKGRRKTRTKPLGTGQEGQNIGVAELRGELEEVLERTDELQESLSVHAFEGTTKRRGKWR